MELEVWGTVNTAELDQAAFTYALKQKQLKTTDVHGFPSLLTAFRGCFIVFLLFQVESRPEIALF